MENKFTVDDVMVRFFIMETKQFKVEYRLTLKDGSYLETTTYVAAKDRDIALTKLKMWRETHHNNKYKTVGLQCNF
jgi:hypothetical protein